MRHLISWYDKQKLLSSTINLKHFWILNIFIFVCAVLSNIGPFESIFRYIYIGLSGMVFGIMGYGVLLNKKSLWDSKLLLTFGLNLIWGVITLDIFGILWAFDILYGLILFHRYDIYLFRRFQKYK